MVFVSFGYSTQGVDGWFASPGHPGQHSSGARLQQYARPCRHMPSSSGAKHCKSVLKAQLSSCMKPVLLAKGRLAWQLRKGGLVTPPHLHLCEDDRSHTYGTSLCAFQRLLPPKPIDSLCQSTENCQNRMGGPIPIHHPGPSSSPRCQPSEAAHLACLRKPSHQIVDSSDPKNAQHYRKKEK